MRKLMVTLALIFAFSSVAIADALTFGWLTVTGATSYKIYQSGDLGVTWTLIGTVPAPPATIVVPADKLYIFRVSAVNATQEVINTSRGAWYNGVWETTPRQFWNQ